MRILYTTLSTPFPQTHGQRLRNWAILLALRDLGHEVDLVSFDDGAIQGPPRELSEICRSVRLVVMPDLPHGLAMYWSRLKALPGWRPEGVARFRSENMRVAIVDVLQSRSYDLAIVDDIYEFGNLPNGMLVPCLLNKHDFLSVILRRYSERHPNPVLSAYARLESAKVWSWEKKCIKASAATMFCSELDLKIIREVYPDSPAFVVPNAIDVARYPFGEESESNQLLYCGAIDWYPNRDAVQFFLRKIFPLVRRAVPDVTLVVTGAKPGDEFIRKEVRDAPVQFTGFVPDIKKVIASARASIVPLRVGSGTRLKILEAAAIGCPVISTSIGAEGLDFVNREEILIADEPASFAESVVEILQKPERRRAMRRAARQRVEAHYGLGAVRKSLDDALRVNGLLQNALDPR